MTPPELVGPEVVLVTGTGTDVGKTWLACRVLEHLRAQGLSVDAWKPVQSFQAGGGPTDADLLGEAAGMMPYEVCPEHHWYELPQAPPMAARELRRSAILLDEIVASKTVSDADVLVCETVGGVCSPIADDADTLDLARRIKPDLVVLVAEAGLGVLHDVRIAARALEDYTLVVALNRFDPSDLLQIRNCAWLRARDHLDVVVTSEEVAARVGAGLRTRTV